MKNKSYSSLLFIICLFLIGDVFPIVTGFHIQQKSTITTSSISSSSLAFSNNNNNKGDKLREATGIRPSLHPTTINAIADALKIRAMKQNNNDNGEKMMVFRVSDTVQPIDIAITAGQIASTAIAKRQQSSTNDGMKLTPKEELSNVLFCFLFLSLSLPFTNQKFVF